MIYNRSYIMRENSERKFESTSNRLRFESVYYKTRHYSEAALRNERIVEV